MKIEWESCGLQGGDDNIGYVIASEEIDKNKLINWTNVSENFKRGFLETYEEAYNQVADVSSDELEIGVNTITILDHIGTMINKNQMKNQSFKELYSQLEISLGE